MNKIGVIELYHHYELVDFWATVFAPDQYSMEFYLSESVQKNLDQLPGTSKTFIKDQGTSLAAFLLKHQSSLSSLDLIIITTIAADFRSWANWQISTPLIWFVHNQHAFFAPRKYIFRGECRKDLWRSAGRLIKHFLLKREIRWRKQWVNKYPIAFFPAHSWDAAVESKFPSRPLPVTFFAPASALPDDTGRKVVTICIPGTVRSQGRDYQMVVRCLKNILPHLIRPVSISLLGNATSKDGPAILELFQQIEHPLFQLDYALSTIAPDQFQTKLKSADFLLLPLKRTVCYSIYEEEVGKSKISGGVNDMIRSGKPLLLPDFYPLSLDLEKMTARYSHEKELEQLLIKWINELHFRPIAMEAAEHLKDYAIDITRQKTVRVLKACFKFH